MRLLSGAAQAARQQLFSKCDYLAEWRKPPGKSNVVTTWPERLVPFRYGFQRAAKRRDNRSVETERGEW